MNLEKIGWKNVKNCLIKRYPKQKNMQMPRNTLKLSYSMHEHSSSSRDLGWHKEIETIQNEIKLLSEKEYVRDERIRIEQELSSNKRN